MNTVIKVDFVKKRVVKRTSKKQNPQSLRSCQEAELYIKMMKKKLGETQYVALLEGLASHIHYKKLNKRLRLYAETFFEI